MPSHPTAMIKPPQLPRQLTPDEEHDIQSSFRAMDVHRLGELSFDDTYAMYLALGYAFLEESDFRKLLRSVSPDHQYNPRVPITLQVARKLFAQCKPKNRERTFHEWFQAIDTDGKGHITAEDLRKLSEEVGEPITAEEAQRMAEAAMLHGRQLAVSDEDLEQMDREIAQHGGVTRRVFRTVASSR